MSLPDKAPLLAALLARVRTDLEEALRSQRVAQEGATHAEMRAEDPKDMRSTEVSYLARGLAERAETAAAAVSALEGFHPPRFAPDAEIALGALVAAEDEDGERALYLLVPAGGGERLEHDGARVQTLTPATPLGRLLMGQRVGDGVRARLPRGVRELEIVAVA
jgi:hypothetical protein